ncbi:MAG: ATP-grasp domain-containing protein [Myxococcales bacterium]|nr:ATP-grasp domain-containing protein [Myxococcales bacterium]
MRIALTHNLQLSDAEEEAEFDRPETIAALADALRSLGHEVEPVEVSGPASRTVARLEALSPDLVFNTAEGRRGRFREAFYPALFDELGLPFTGSDAYVCALTLDKQLTKMMVAAHGVPTPAWRFVDDLAALDVGELRFPVIVKPNFEGSSKGITVDSIVEERAQLIARVAELLQRYPSGLLVEEFIRGRDVTVPFLERGSPTTEGILPAAEYAFDPAVVGERKYNIYDYHLKQVAYNAVRVDVPARLSDAAAAELAQLTRKVVRVLGIRDLGRVDYRITDDGKIYFLEVNALPSLEPGASIYRSSELVGLATVPLVLDAVVRSALERRGITPMRSPKRARKRLRVGLIFNLKRVQAEKSGAHDDEAEFDSPKTVAAIREAIESYGHDVVELEATRELPTILPAAAIDVAFNIAEGFAGRSREALVPALLELLGIPYTGSDPATLSLALDKAMAKRIVREAGVATAPFLVMSTGREKLPRGFTFPALAKPLAEGSSKGVGANCVVASEAELRALVKDLLGKYRQPVLCESFLSGREFTVGVLGERRPRVLPPMEIVFLDPEISHPIYSFDAKVDFSDKIRYDTPAKVDPELGRQLEAAAKAVFAALDCRDVARIDFRLDAAGRVNFIECNPLPGLTPGWSDLVMIAKSAGLDYRGLIGEILAPAIRRFKAERGKTAT